MGTKPAILIIDDEPNVVDSLRDLLRFDFQVFGATSAEEGLIIFRRESLRVVLSDQRMPGTTGVEFLGQCHSENPDVTRLLMTGYADVRAVINAINKGMVYRYISKPWDPDELQTVIREASARYELLIDRKRLMEELQARNTELETKNAELRQADHTKTAFIKVASHELRTPLTILSGMTDLALRSAPEDSASTGWLQKIQEASGRLQHLVDQLVEMLAAGQTEVQQDLRTVELGALLHRAADDLRDFALQRGQSITVEVPADLGTVVADGARLRNCLSQLLTNAIKFTPDGGQILLKGDRAPGRVTLTVQDNGDGIPSEDLPRLFDPFFTSFDVSRHSSGQFEYGCRGLGLGLSLVRALVEMQGGEIAVESTPGSGTTFVITLPDR